MMLIFGIQNPFATDIPADLQHVVPEFGARPDVENWGHGAADKQAHQLIPDLSDDVVAAQMRRGSQQGDGRGDLREHDHQVNEQIGRSRDDVLNFAAFFGRLRDNGDPGQMGADVVEHADVTEGVQQDRVDGYNEVQEQEEVDVVECRRRYHGLALFI